jgi:hypothetical protein
MDKVVFLAHRSDKADTEYTEHLTCANCKNKTYIAIYTKNSEFPMMQCAACGNLAGYFGWINEENVNG